MGLEDGEECYRILDAEMPKIPKGETDKLKWMLDNHKMGSKDTKGERKLQKKV